MLAEQHSHNGQLQGENKISKEAKTGLSFV
jgi:hypothetical protein